MRKKWLYLFGLSVVAGLAGCSSESDPDSVMTECLSDTGQTYYCASNEICCNGGCVKETDMNCGICGNRCSEGSHCQAGLCVCPATGTFCSMTCISSGCVDTLTNPSHCGGENIACKGGEVCDSGVCSTSCSYDLDNCDGRCIDLENNVDNCGACGNACAKADASNNVSRSYCLNGSCHIICASGYMDADEDGKTCEQNVSFTCGNGIVELGETCDGTRLNDQTCATVVGPGSTGILTCLPDCGGFDTTGCSASSTCGNGMIDGSEMCDGSNLGGATCATILGEGSSGYLGCNANCSDYDTTYCSAPTTCGNSKIDAGESCDGALLPPSTTCEGIVGKGSTGNVSCAPNCYAFDRSNCTAASVCGNGLLESGEECDGNNFNGKTCESIIGSGSRGSLMCNGCVISAEHCSAASTCGNNTIDGNDVCDGTALNGATCASVVGEGSTGTITCRDNCSGYDISGCTAAAKCGNGIIEAGEVCDGARLNDRTCASENGFGSTGTLTCSPDCLSFDVSGCTASTTCGNGIIEAGEVCDGTALNGATCDSQVGSGSTGTLLCGSDCKYYNLSGCSAATQCGNGKLDSGEVCDGKNLNNATCESIVGKGSTGTIRCGDGCKHYDTSACSRSDFCGDGEINQNEVCDGKTLAGRTCADVVGFGSKGTLQCSSNCMDFDTSLCTPADLCGNGKLDSGEVCDGAMLNGATCSALVGFGSTGKLTCNDKCTEVITTGCSEPKPCGNGILDEGEACDGGILNGKTCVDVVGFGSTGTPQCNATCTGFSKGTCTPAVKCGNGMLDTGEKCDTTNLNGKTCADVVGLGSTGTLTCDAACNFNTTLCTASRGCGNGTLEDNEECDGNVFAAGSNLCKTYAPSLYKSGKITCDQNCRVVTSACTAYCGDGTVNGTVNGIPINEACDGEKFPVGQNTCEKVVGTGSTGTLACSGDCKSIMTNQCTAAAYCGDGKVNLQEEQCDGLAFSLGTDDCAAYSDKYQAGEKVKCLGTCKVDTSACKTKPYCGDGSVNTNNEWCDRDAIRDNKVNCTDWDAATYSSGKVKCNNNTCELDMSSCVEKPTVKCGNGKLDDKEFCDGAVFAEGMKTCAEWSAEFSGGTIKCTKDCQIDDSACEVAQKCGNGTIDPGEVCDGNKLPFNYTACKTYNTALYEKGTIKCSADCKGLDLSACVSWCGNGKVNSSSNGVAIGEVCDGANLNKKTCEKIVGTGSTGTLACANDCKSFDTSNCSEPVVATCGDGIVNQVSEYCDGAEFKNGKSACNYWNGAYISGEMKCTKSCTLDESGCVSEAAPVCGDGILNQNNEECDINAYDPDWDTCEKVDPKYGGGTLKCTKTCEIDDSSCILKAQINCGNGKLDDGEYCDGQEFIVSSCAEYSSAFGSGSLKCTNACEIDASGCVAHECGDGVLGPDEECDGKAFDPAWDTCVKVSPLYSGGTLACTNSCEVNPSGCTLKCGNGKLDDNEWCDGSNFIDNENKCSDWGFASGTLGCSKTCEIDTTGCRATPEAYCGDGAINTNAEECDGADFLHGIKACAEFAPSLYASGNLKCTQGCKIDESACVKKPVPQCGDGNLDDGEDCDGKVFRGGISTCNAYSNAYISGNLACSKSCKIDTSACQTAPINLCGNGKLDAGEKCDGALFENNKSNCSDWGNFAAGAAACSASCEIVLTNCILESETAKCGDNKINTAEEECDGNAGNIYGVTACSAYSNTFTSGNLKCTNCKIDTSACVKAANTCGNGKLDENEWCDGNKFMDGISTCADYSPYYNGGTLKCDASCEFDVSACTRTPVCAEGETRCSGQSLQMCDDVHNAWYEMSLCGSGIYAKKPVCWAENGDGNCEAATDPVVNLEWCNFQWVTNDADHIGYGRILVPNGEDPNQILAYMACTNDLSKPVSKWTAVNADLNNSCGNCGQNKEFMTTESYKGVGGTNYCTFIFDFLKPNDTDVYACRPVQDGPSAPIRVIANKTMLTAELTRSFNVGSCNESDVQCNGQQLQMCIDGVWETMQECSGATPICDAQKESCIGQNTNLVTMNDWYQANKTGYSNTKASPAFADGSLVTVTGAFYISDYIIDGVTAILNAKNTYNTSIVISNLKGVGSISFDYKTWGSDSATLNITDGTTNTTLSVKSSDTTVKTFNYAFNNNNAKTVTITPESKGSAGRVLIDNISWTSN